MNSLPLHPPSFRWLALCALALWLALLPAGASDLVRDLAAGRPRKVVAYGTSLTAGGVWVGQMQTWLAGTYPGTMTLINSGLSGKNSAEGLAQLQAKVLAHAPDTVFLEFTMNDAFLYSDGTSSLSVVEARTNLEAMIEAILGQNPRAEIILQTMNSVWNSPTGSNESATLRPNLPAYYQMYREVAAERGLLLIDHYPNWVNLQNTNAAQFQSYVADGLHPNAAGIKAIALPLLQRKLVGAVDYLPVTPPAPRLLETDVCVYGGSSGATAAAVQAARAGRSVVLLSPDRQLGGLSTNGLGWTDIGSPSAIGGLAREFYRRIYHYYLDDSAWTTETRSAYVSRSGIKPDTGRKMMFTFEPKVALQFFEDMLAESGVTVVRGRLKRTAGGVQVADRRIREIMTDDGQTSIRAAMFIDGTYEGDLMAAAGVSYAIGREPNAQYDETLNGIQTARSGGNQLPNGIDPYVVPGQASSGLLPGVNANAGGVDGAGDARLQAYTFRMALTNAAENRLPVPKPPGYQESDQEILFRAIAAGQTTNFFKTSPMPNRKTDSNNSTGASTDFIGGNYDLAGGWNYAEADYAKREEIIAAHVRYQQGFVWALQNSPRVPANIRTAWSAWGLPADEFAENGGWPDQLYIREARRLVGDLVIHQKHVDQEAGFVATDSVGMGGYNMDSHHVQRHAGGGTVKNEGDVQVAPKRGPYGISYRALVPKAAEIENLLVPVAVSSSHIAYGSIRMEPVFMILGQSAGAAAVLAIEDGVSVQQVDYAKLRRSLLAAGQVLTLGAVEPNPAGLVDNADATGVALTGTWLASTATPGFYGLDYLHDENTGKGTKSVRFTPTLETAGTYEVFARWVAHTNRATNARYDILHSGGTATVRKNQRENNGVWVSLGSYTFAAGTAGAVVVRNDGTDGYVIADAVRFVPPGGDAPAVTVFASAARTAETGGAPGAITVLRESAGTDPLNVRLSIGGTATAGTDYKAIPSVLTLPAGSMAATVLIQAFPDALTEGTETVTVTLAPDPAYTIANPASATVLILDPPFERWKASHFTPAELADPLISGELADADRDGKSNLLEYGTGTDPRAPDGTHLPLLHLDIETDGGTLSLYYVKAGEDLAYEVQQSPTLAAGFWTHEGVSPERYDAASGLFYQSVPVIPGEPARFLRLQVWKL